MEYVPYVAAVAALLGAGIMLVLRQGPRVPHLLRSNASEPLPTDANYDRTEFHLTDGTSRKILRRRSDQAIVFRTPWRSAPSKVERPIGEKLTCL
jgi:hypothetical protein